MLKEFVLPDGIELILQAIGRVSHWQPFHNPVKEGLPTIHPVPAGAYVV
jgi:hypothetical protein